MRVFGITGHSGSGKTTLIEKLLPILRARGHTVSLIKHTHHGFDIDKPGKDSHRLREAGAHEVLLAGDARWVLMHELRGEHEPTLEQQLARLTPVDFALVEGYKRAPIPKLEVWRSENQHAPRFPEESTIVAVAVDGVAPECCSLPIFQLSSTEQIADFVLQHAASANLG